MSTIQNAIDLDTLLCYLSLEISRPALLRIGDGNNGRSCPLKFVKEIYYSS